MGHPFKSKKENTAQGQKTDLAAMQAACWGAEPWISSAKVFFHSLILHSALLLLCNTWTLVT